MKRKVLVGECYGLAFPPYGPGAHWQLLPAWGFLWAWQNRNSGRCKPKRCLWEVYWGTHTLKGRLQSWPRDDRGWVFFWGGGFGGGGLWSRTCLLGLSLLNCFPFSHFIILPEARSSRRVSMSSLAMPILWPVRALGWLTHRDTSQREGRNSPRGGGGTSSRRGNGQCLLLPITMTTASGRGLRISGLD